MHVNARWDVFARENDGESAVASEVVGRPLISFLSDATIRMLYRRMIEAAQAGRTITFRYRCDAPRERRVLEMVIRGAGRGEVDFISTIKELAQRDPIAFFDRRAARTDEHLRICSWCQKIAISPTEWVEADEAVNTLGLLLAGPVPRMTHGICQRCKDEMLRLLPREN